MAYIGNTSVTTNIQPATDFFSGNGSTTAFTLSRTVVSTFTILAVINNVQQNPSSAYTVSGNVITFTSAPPSGTNNIYVNYNSIQGQVVGIGQGTVGTNQLAAITNIFTSVSDFTLQTGGSNTTALTVDQNQNVRMFGNITTMSGTGALVLPSGTTAQRPTTPTIGMQRWNTTTGQAEVYTGFSWQTIALGLYQIDYLVVAGGGGGGGSVNSLGGGGGGGAGGLLFGSMTLGAGTPYSLVVGSGGPAVSANTGAQGNTGNNSTGFGLTALGGGGGDSGSSSSSGKSGGSGGGGGYRGYTTVANGGSGTTGQGNAGSGVSATSASGGGGGGYSSGGLSNTGSGGGSGGTGGTGYTWLNGSVYSTGGQGGAAAVSADATANTGNGGPGAYAAAQTWSGGSGVVIVRYLGNQRASGGTVSSSGGYTYHTFTTSGTFTS